MSTTSARSRTSPARPPRLGRGRARRDPHEPTSGDEDRRRVGDEPVEGVREPGGARGAAAHGRIGDDEGDAARLDREGVRTLERRGVAGGGEVLARDVEGARVHVRPRSSRTGPSRARSTSSAPEPTNGSHTTSSARPPARRARAAAIVGCEAAGTSPRRQAKRGSSSARGASEASTERPLGVLDLTSSQSEAVGSLTSSGARAVTARATFHVTARRWPPPPTRCDSARGRPSTSRARHAPRRW